MVEVRRGLPRTLLTVLALRAGETVTSDSLVELLWGDEQPRNPANALQIQVSYLRKTLGAAEPGESRIVTRPGGYLLDIDPDDIDARRFEHLVREATATAAAGTATALEEAAAKLDDALALWRGDALVDVAGEPFAIGEVSRLTEVRWEAVEARNDILLALGRHRELVGPLSQLVNENPLRERFHEQLMLALYRSGRQADALRAYEDARHVLVEELGLDPGPELQQLEHDILDQSPHLAWTPPPAGERVAPAPAPAPVRTRVAGLPNPVTSLIGRQVEMTRVRGLLDRSRMVTLTGPAGAGKTRLAIEVARQFFDPAAVVYVDFVGVTEPDAVAPAVAAAVGVPVAPDDDPVDAVVQRLAQGDTDPTLLLFDTCEHVLGAAAEVASRVLRDAPQARVLATSRRALAVSGEVAWPVPPLALAPPSAVGAQAAASYPAVELFARRAADVRPDFELTDANAADVAAICLALDGLPLAIELAAARADVLTPAAIRARLEDRFALLVDGSRDVAPRQQTLRAAIDWSFHLLDDEQQRLFARLSVFAGTFALDAVLAIAGDDFDDPLAVLSGLVRNSVVMVAGDDRYRLLDSLRAYAVDQLGDDAEDARRRHAEHYVEVAEAAAPRIRAAEQVEWLERLRRDLPNFRAALAWSIEAGDDEAAVRMAAALGWFWILDGLLDEAAEVFDRAAAMTSVRPDLRVRVLPWLGLLTASLGDLHRAKEAGEQAVALARSIEDPAALGLALNTVAVAQWAFGDLKEAARTHDEAIAAFEAAGDPWGLGVCWALRTRTSVDAADADAMERARHAVAMARASGDRHVVGLAVEQLARIHLAEGDAAAAARHASECLELHESIGYSEGTVAALHLLGRAKAALGDTAGARAAHRRALSLATSINHPAATCEALEDLARVAVAEGDHRGALRLLAAAAGERTARGIAPRAASFESLAMVRAAAVAGLGADAGHVEAEAAGWPLDDVVRDLLA